MSRQETPNAKREPNGGHRHRLLGHRDQRHSEAEVERADDETVAAPGVLARSWSSRKPPARRSRPVAIAHSPRRSRRYPCPTNPSSGARRSTRIPATIPIRPAIAPSRRPVGARLPTAQRSVSTAPTIQYTARKLPSRDRPEPDARSVTPRTRAKHPLARNIQYVNRGSAPEAMGPKPTVVRAMFRESAATSPCNCRESASLRSRRAQCAARAAPDAGDQEQRRSPDDNDARDEDEPVQESVHADITRCG